MKITIKNKIILCFTLMTFASYSMMAGDTNKTPAADSTDVQMHDIHYEREFASLLNNGLCTQCQIIMPHTCEAGENPILSVILTIVVGQSAHLVGKSVHRQTFIFELPSEGDYTSHIQTFRDPPEGHNEYIKFDEFAKLLNRCGQYLLMIRNDAAGRHNLSDSDVKGFHSVQTEGEILEQILETLRRRFEYYVDLDRQKRELNSKQEADKAAWAANTPAEQEAIIQAEKLARKERLAASLEERRAARAARAIQEAEMNESA